MPEARIAAQLWTIREKVKTAEDFAASMKRLAEIGYTAVQPNWPVPFESAAELKKVLDGSGLACCATHYKSNLFFEDLDALIADHKTLGCAFPGAGGAPGDARSGEGMAAFGKKMEAVCARLGEAGMRFAYHNHHWEFTRDGDRTWLEVLFDAAPPDFTFELDLYWVQAGGADPVKWIRKCSGRCPVLHFKDMGLEDGEAADMAVGEGNLDWPAILEAADEAGSRWFVVEEDHPAGGDGFASLARSYENLRGMGVE